MAKLIYSAFADEYSDFLVEQCEILNKYDISHLELRSVDGKNVSEFSKEDVKKYKKILTDYRVKVSSICSPLGKATIDKVDEVYFEKAKNVFETACSLDAKYVRCFSFYLPNNEEDFSKYREQIFTAMEKLVSLASEYGLTLCHENEAKIYGESPERCLELVSAFEGKLKCVFDMGNFVLDGFEPYEQAYPLLETHIAYFHIKDALAVGAIVPPGKGEARIKEILDDYQKTNAKDTFISLEPHLQTFSGLNALVGKTFENPYKYENQKVAFIDAIEKLKELLK